MHWLTPDFRFFADIIVLDFYASWRIFSPCSAPNAPAWRTRYHTPPPTTFTSLLRSDVLGMLPLSVEDLFTTYRRFDLRPGLMTSLFTSATRAAFSQLLCLPTYMPCGGRGACRRHAARYPHAIYRRRFSVSCGRRCIVASDASAVLFGDYHHLYRGRHRAPIPPVRDMRCLLPSYLREHLSYAIHLQRYYL